LCILRTVYRIPYRMLKKEEGYNTVGRKTPTPSLPYADECEGYSRRKIWSVARIMYRILAHTYISCGIAYTHRYIMCARADYPTNPNPNPNPKKVMLCYAMLCCVMLCYAYVMLCYAMLFMLRYAILCYSCVMLCCCVMLRYAMLCCAMLCYTCCGVVL
jgi:hypothetical protein